MRNHPFRFATLLLLAIIAILPGRTRAQSPAADFSTLGSRGFDYTQGSYSLGWTFHTNSAITVTALGFYDDLKNGLSGSHPVGIYDLSSHILLTSGTVSPSDPLTGFFRYISVTPITLAAGRDYAIQSVTGRDRYAIDVNSTVINPAITYTGVAFDNNGSATVLTFPTSFEGSIFGNPLPADFYGDFGPNFRFTLGAVANRPTLQSLSPASVTAGSPSLSLTLSGVGFIPNGTSVRFDNTPLTVTSVTATSIVVSVPASLLTTARNYNVLVSVGNKFSNAATFRVTSANTSTPRPAPLLKVVGNLRTGVETGLRYAVFQLQNQGSADLTNLNFTNILLHTESGAQTNMDIGGYLQAVEPLVNFPNASLGVLHPGEVIQIRFAFPGLTAPASGIIFLGGTSGQGNFNAGITSVTIP